MQIQTLLNSLESTIYEGILKLDGCADSSMSIYYDLDSNNIFFQKIRKRKSNTGNVTKQPIPVYCNKRWYFSHL